MTELLVEAGLPAGVLNLINGDPEAMGQEMLDHPAVRKISFTGSVRVGRILMDGASRTVTRLSLELGGNAPVIVMPDVDLEQVTAGAVTSKFRNNGQVCVAPQRFLVHRKVADAFADHAAARTRQLKVGQRPRRGRAGRPAHQRPTARSGGRAGQRRLRARRRRCGLAGSARQRLAARVLLRAHGPRRRHARHAGVRRRDLRSGDAGHAVRRDRRGAGARQPHAVRPGGLRLDQRPARRRQAVRRPRVRYRRRERMGRRMPPRRRSAAGSRAASDTRAAPRDWPSTSKPSSSRWAVWAENA